MDAMIIHKEDIECYSSIGVFDLSVVENYPEKYIFFLSPTEFFVFTDIYLRLGDEVARVLEEKRKFQNLPEFNEHGILYGLALLFTKIGEESTLKRGLGQGYVMGSLTPSAIGKAVYAVFLTRRNDIQSRQIEVNNYIKNWKDQKNKGMFN